MELNQGDILNQAKAIKDARDAEREAAIRATEQRMAQDFRRDYDYRTALLTAVCEVAGLPPPDSPEYKEVLNDLVKRWGHHPVAQQPEYYIPLPGVVYCKANNAIVLKIMRNGESLWHRGRLEFRASEGDYLLARLFYGHDHYYCLLPASRISLAEFFAGLL
jgi:hypothetical protein